MSNGRTNALMLNLHHYSARGFVSTSKDVVE
jgi:hypothetical protein